jgi:hypothetical protein
MGRDIKCEGQYDFENAKSEYREFCSTEKSLPVFAQDWYLDAVCDSPEDWKVILVKNNNTITAAFPFRYTCSKLGLYTINNPLLTNRLGIWMANEERKTNFSKEKFENHVVSEVISKLPKYDSFRILFENRFKNWQAFYREDFTQTTYYSYVIYNDSSTEEIFKAIDHNKRRQIQRAQESMEIRYDIRGEEFYDFMEKTYQKRNRIIFYSRQFFLRLHEAVNRHHAGKIRSAVDKNGDINAVLLAVEDALRTYTIISAHDSEKGYDALAYLFWDVISETINQGKTFDFEGSMIHDVARFYSAFNPVKEPYFIISKHSEKMRLLQNSKDNLRIIGSMLGRKGKISILNGR